MRSPFLHGLATGDGRRNHPCDARVGERCRQHLPADRTRGTNQNNRNGVAESGLVMCRL